MPYGDKSFLTALCRIRPVYTPDLHMARIKMYTPYTETSADFTVTIPVPGSHACRRRNFQYRIINREAGPGFPAGRPGGPGKLKDI
ncbi:hypothetical protein A6M21_03170 [Desulfotomaculum copahuensis]|uniref:Uncharacterized protein n=1 Tax=Desulfotomaculum copahuensis TaxID=1838280 RepID=A0A1B7LIN6_9FIRM|nr:hypothetical protein A6M21_03170 [Desulfotomaculum copahuensis]